MARVDVVSTIRIYEIDGSEEFPQESALRVRSHWNCDDRVEIELEGRRVTVVASDLKAAIANATNTR